MKENKSLLFILGVVIVLLIVGVGFAILRDYFGQVNPAAPEDKSQKAEEIIPPAATGQISDLADALEKEIIDEMDIVYEEDESDLIISDSEEINDFGQAADDTGL